MSDRGAWPSVSMSSALIEASSPIAMSRYEGDDPYDHSVYGLDEDSTDKDRAGCVVVMFCAAT